MLGIEDYGSDNDSDHDEPPKKSTSETSSISSSGPTQAAKPKRPKKIAIGLPSLSSVKDDEDDILKDERPAKKPRLQSGAGVSSLLSMLPAPKQKHPLPSPSGRERVLGGGSGPGLVFSTRSQVVDGVSDTHNGRDTGTEDQVVPPPASNATDAATQHSSALHPFLPPSLAKGKPSISVEEGTNPSRTRTKNPAPAVDFFSLENSTKTTTAIASSSTSSLLSSLSSAPSIPTFEPPEPSQTDPYPGYYQLPSGTWAAHDPVMYAKFVKKWESEYNAHVRALEKGAVKGFEGLDTAAVEEVDAMKEMERAKVELKEREERKAVTRGADGGPVAPKMTLNASKLSGIARSRHQLSTLLKEAYENREALEERIAQGRRNRKEAGNKYGF